MPNGTSLNVLNLHWVSMPLTMCSIRIICWHITKFKVRHVRHLDKSDLKSQSCDLKCQENTQKLPQSCEKGRKTTIQVFQNTKNNDYLLQTRFEAHLDIPKEIWISNLEAPLPTPYVGNCRCIPLAIMPMYPYQEKQISPRLLPLT